MKQIKIQGQKAKRFLVILLGLCLYIGVLIQVGKGERVDLVSTEGRDFEKAVVTEVVQDNLQANGVRSGYQQLKIKMLTGTRKGEFFDATSAEGNLFGAICKEGDKVIVVFSEAGDNVTASVYAKDREAAIFIFVAIFLLAICLVGGKNGVKSVIALAFTFISILYLFMPMIYKGYSPFLCAILVVVITTMVTMYFIGGMTKKTLTAIVGTTLGVLIAGISAFFFGKAAGIDGYNVSEIETLVYVGQNTKIQIGGLLFAGVLISSLGAVMDVAMSVASVIAELHETNPQLTWKELFTSGLKVGRDAMGTMSNTLILAFVGGSITTLVINYAYKLPYLQLINSYSIGIEIMQGIAGSLGIVLTVPCVALAGSLLIGIKKQ